MPDVKTIAKQEATSIRQAPACLGTFVFIIAGQILAIPPFPFDKAAIPADLAAAWLGDRCLKN